MIGQLASMPLPAIMTGFGHTTYPTPGMSTSEMSFDSPSPSPLLLSAPLLNFERLLKCARVSSFTGTSPDDLQSSAKRVWNLQQQQEFG
jgi:hypothetical protein